MSELQDVERRGLYMLYRGIGFQRTAESISRVCSGATAIILQRAVVTCLAEIALFRWGISALQLGCILGN
ncbi:hypothetical protein M9H77_26214 [Catharanthus roseus]|uniref:Uncharacterized protein n=1 Tax=Catharanthus roseus TaxID=4058 RepID=A0ACC0AD41_CATRO|nr:hypothetical protein M9H77_26214 [Catharanthus roseus]